MAFYIKFLFQECSRVSYEDFYFKSAVAFYIKFLFQECSRISYEAFYFSKHQVRPLSSLIQSVLFLNCTQSTCLVYYGKDVLVSLKMQKHKHQDSSVNCFGGGCQYCFAS